MIATWQREQQLDGAVPIGTKNTSFPDSKERRQGKIENPIGNGFRNTNVAPSSRKGHDGMACLPGPIKYSNWSRASHLHSPLVIPFGAIIQSLLQVLLSGFGSCSFCFFLIVFSLPQVGNASARTTPRRDDGTQRLLRLVKDFARKVGLSEVSFFFGRLQKCPGVVSQICFPAR